MDTKNQTRPTEFIFLGFSNDVKVNNVLFILLLLIYLFGANANVLIILIIINSPQLHVPMYFFLCILSFLDMCFLSAVVPRLLADLIFLHGTISYRDCTAQFYTILLVGGMECLLLVLMAYDRYAAICHPLLYPVLMRWSVCYRLVAFIWILSFIVFIVPALATPLPVCYPNLIDHYMCEVLSVLQLACEKNIRSLETKLVAMCFIAVFLPFVFILVSYLYVISSVMRIQSAARSKAFSTCSSHVTVVALFFGLAIITYSAPSAQYTKSQRKYIALFHNVVCPTLNPIIYSLNNKDVKHMHRKLLSKFVTRYDIKVM